MNWLSADSSAHMGVSTMVRFSVFVCAVLVACFPAFARAQLIAHAVEGRELAWRAHVPGFEGLSAVSMSKDVVLVQGCIAVGYGQVLANGSLAISLRGHFADLHNANRRKFHVQSGIISLESRQVPSLLTCSCLGMRVIVDCRLLSLLSLLT